MKLIVVTLALGPLQNNVYILADQETKSAVVIDPSFNSQQIIKEVTTRGWRLRAIWLTHSHYDHIAGVHLVQKSYEPPLPLGMHQDAQKWDISHGKKLTFGIPLEPLPPANLYFEDQQWLSLDPAGGELVTQVRLAPGHCPGSMIYFCPSLQLAFVGDVIFRDSIGRSDLPGGSHAVLLNSIREQVLSLPDTTTLLPGHGPESSVGYERINNIYLA